MPADGLAPTLSHEIDDRGHGRTAVLIHSLALDRSVWDGLRGHLAATHDLVLLDLPGHGGSSAIREPTIDWMADEVERLLAVSLGATPVMAIGMSLGGCVAQALAIRHPHRVMRLGLIDTTCWYGPSAEADWAERAGRAERDGMGSLVEFQLERWFTPRFRAEQPDEGQRLLKVFGRTQLPDYVATCRAMGAMDMRESVRAIRVRTAIVVGDQDKATPPRHAHDLHERIAGSTLQVLSGCAHLSAVERPDAVCAALRPVGLAKSNPHIRYLERTLPSASTAGSLSSSGAH